MLSDPRLNNHPNLKLLLQNVEQDIHNNRSDSAGTDLRKVLEYILKEYSYLFGKDRSNVKLYKILEQFKDEKRFDAKSHSDNHLTRKDMRLFYDIKELGNDESHFDPANPNQGRISVAKAQSLYEDLILFLPRFLDDIPDVLTAPVKKKASAASPARQTSPALSPRPIQPIHPSGSSASWSSTTVQTAPEPSRHQAEPRKETASMSFIIKDRILTGYRNETNEKTVIIPNGVTAIGDAAFFDCGKIEAILLPDSVTQIGKQAFSGCANLKSITIPAGVTNIGESAFWGCSDLSSVTFLNSNVSIEDCAFWGCEGLADDRGFIIVKNVLYGYFGQETSVAVPTGVVKIDSFTFAYHEELTDIVIPDSVEIIGDNVFGGCENLVSVRIPQCVKSVGKNLFWGCEKLKRAAVPGGWGPERATFTMEKPAHYPTFNSITNNPTIGDERDFVRIGELGTETTDLKNEVEIIPGRQYLVYIYFHNDASATYNDSAHNNSGVALQVRLSTTFSKVLTPGSKGYVSATISSENSTPASVWDGAYLTTSAEKVFLKYVADSAKIHSDWKANNSALPDSLFTEEGALIGLNELNGVIPGCEEYHGVVTYVLQAKAIDADNVI